MILQQIVGRSGTGKSLNCLNEVRQQLLEQPMGPPIIYIVPEQMTFQTEYALITTPGLDGMIRAQVFSFTRLAWKVLQDVGGMTRQHLDSTGIRMLLRKIIENHKKDLVMYQKAADQGGFIEQLENLLIEYKRNQITPAGLQGVINKADKLLANKMIDINRIFTDFEKELATKYVASEDYLDLLCNKIADSTYIKNATIYIDGFHGFTPQELSVVEACLKYAQKVTITHTVDKAYDSDLPHELSLFHSTAITYQSVKERAQSISAEILPPIILTKSNKDNISSEINHLERNYHRWPIKEYPNTIKSSDSNINIATAVNIRVEVEGLARQIIRKVRDEGYRYRDLVVITRNINDYQPLIETVFKDYRIPVFFDQKKTMLHHPLIELVRSSLDVINHNWHYEAVFRCIKTDLLSPKRDQLDKLENYVLAHGIRGKNKWTSEDTWKYKTYHIVEEQIEQTEIERKIEKELNELRWEIAKPLIDLSKQFAKAESGVDFAKALFEFLLVLDVPKSLEEWERKAEKEGEVSTTKHHQQAWQAVVNLLDQVVEIIGNDKMTTSLFAQIIETGLESLHFNMVPPAFDQVIVATLDNSRLTNIKCSFVIGVNEGIIPAKIKEEGILTERDRESIKAIGIKLASSFKQKMFEEPFVIYNALVSATDYLWISYPLADLEGKQLLASTLINQIETMFPQANKHFLVIEPNDLPDDLQLSYITNPDKTLSYLTTQLRHWQRGYHISPLWWDVYNWYMTTDATDAEKVRLTLAIDSLFYKNSEQNLNTKTSNLLYGENIQTSVSRLEQYKRCPFAHFANYGLKLKDREVYRLEALDVGNLYHASLKSIADNLAAANKEWHTVTDEQYQQLVEQTVDELAPRLAREVLYSSKRYNYIMTKLKRVITRTVTVLGKQSETSKFKPIQMELGFGFDEKGSLPAVGIKLTDGSIMKLRGRIDRVDGHNNYLSIIDYKSSAMSLNETELFDGSALQMLTYLDVVLTFADKLLTDKLSSHEDNAKPAATLYFHVHNPMLGAEDVMSATDALTEIKLFQKFKLRGFVIKDKNVLKLIDSNITDQASSSDVIPVSIKRDGDFGAYSKVLTEEQFTKLRIHIKNNIANIGSNIKAGDINIFPSKTAQKNACTYCEYKAVCQFDNELVENTYRYLTRIDNVDTLFAKIAGVSKLEQQRCEEDGSEPILCEIQQDKLLSDREQQDGEQQDGERQDGEQQEGEQQDSEGGVSDDN